MNNYSDDKAATGEGSSRKSIPRPIHYTRELNEKPASNEPKSSYTDDSEYLNEEYFLGKLGRSSRKYKASRTVSSTESLKTFDSSETNSMSGQPRSNNHPVLKSHSVGTMIVEMDDEVFSPPQNKLIEDSNAQIVRGDLGRGGQSGNSLSVEKIRRSQFGKVTLRPRRSRSADFVFVDGKKKPWNGHQKARKDKQQARYQYEVGAGVGGDFYIGDNSDSNESSENDDYCPPEINNYIPSEIEIKVLQLIENVENNLIKGSPKLVLEKLNLRFDDIPYHLLSTEPLCSKLHKLSLKNNSIYELSPVIVQGRMTGLSTLILQHCDLRSLPDNWNLPNLRILDLSHNKLSWVGVTTFEGVSKLEHLDFFANELEELELPIFTQLSYLNIGYNYLKKLPTRIHLLEKLRILKIGGNNISKIPEEVVLDLELKELEVVPNDLEVPPLSICKRGRKAMRRYYLDKRSESKRVPKKKRGERSKKMSSKDKRNLSRLRSSTSVDTYVATNNTIRVIFIGNAMMGKTSTIHGLRHCHLEQPSSESTSRHLGRTIGIEIHRMESNSEESSKTPLLLNLWDFAGQHVYHGTHEIFFSPHSLYVVVWNMMASSSERLHNRISAEAEKTLKEDIDLKIQYWIDCVQSSIPGAVILIVVTHDDVVEPDLARERCDFMQKRIIMHEESRCRDLNDRLKSLTQKHQADSTEANRLRFLVRNRPKIKFDSRYGVVNRVSGNLSKLSGFTQLRETIVEIAESLLRTHVGIDLPKVYQSTESLVRRLKEEAPIISFTKFTELLRIEEDIEHDMQVVDALHFLADNGELCFFRENSEQIGNLSNSWHCGDSEHLLQSLSKEIIFLVPHWLVNALATILRHDLSLRLRGGNEERFGAKHNLATNCPYISTEEAKILWDRNDYIANGYNAALKRKFILAFSEERYSFLSSLLVRFNVLVPMVQPVRTSNLTESNLVYFLPSLLDDTAAERWEYKKCKAFEATICTTWRLLNFIPPGFFERITGNILRRLWARIDDSFASTDNANRLHRLKPLQIHCWKRALFLELLLGDDTRVHIFVQIENRDSEECVASEGMVDDEKRLIVSARGPLGSFSLCGELLYKGGLKLALSVIEKVLDGYEGLSFEKEGVCPKCLLYLPSRRLARVWQWQVIRSTIKDGADQLVCDYGHSTDLRLIVGEVTSKRDEASSPVHTLFGKVFCEFKEEVKIPLKKCFGAVVLIALWSEFSSKLVPCGSGFIVDAKRGLIVTAAHCLIDLVENEDGFVDAFSREAATQSAISLGTKSREGTFNKIFIGILKRKESGDHLTDAIFRYRAEIVEYDSSYRVDACVLKLVSKLDLDMRSTDRKRCTESAIPPSHLPRKRASFFKREHLSQLRATPTDPEIGDFVHILGFDQQVDDDDKFRRYQSDMNVCLDCPLGRIRSIWNSNDHDTPSIDRILACSRENRFKWLIRKEIKVQCNTSLGLSGGPAVNFKGEVVGINTQGEHRHYNCYIAPTSEWIKLVQKHSPD